ncbi:hypothetical protein ACTXT7_009323 [Hymenolepis weldensis]
MCEIVNLIVAPGSLRINIVCHQVARPYRSEKLSVSRMVVAEAQLIQRYFGTSPVHAIPSSSYNRPVQLKHTYNYVLTRALIQLTNINSLSTHTDCRPSDASSFVPFFNHPIPFGCLYCINYENDEAILSFTVK